MAALALAGAALLSGCRGGGDDERLVLDGRPRHPDDQGVLTAVSREELTLDGKRTYAVSPELQSFSTFDLQTISVFSRRDQYVQVGLDGKTVVWMAGVAAVIPNPPRVFYVGRLESVDAGAAVFADGTVLRIGRGVTMPEPGTRLQVEIDPARHAIRKVTVA